MSDKLGILTKKVFWPYVTQEDKKAVMNVLERGILFGHTEADGRVFAPETDSLQKEYADYIGVTYCLAVNSGTAALHIALAGCGIGPGDEVITSAFSYVATPMAILHAHAIPVFVDIDINTHNIDVSKIEEKITSRTRAIMPVHMNGLPCDMDAITEIAKRHNLFVIEDAAQAGGSFYKDKRAGSIGHAAGFSLNGTKNFSVGEGGLFVTSDFNIYERAKAVATMAVGTDEIFDQDYSDKRFWHLIGYNYKVQELTSALARSRLRSLDAVNDCGVSNAAVLDRILGDIPEVVIQKIPLGYTSTYYKYRFWINLPQAGIKLRDAVFQALRAEDVDVTMWQRDPLPALPAFQLKRGYGYSCPWVHGRKQNYSIKDYPATQKLLDTSIIVCSESYPIFCQPPEVVEYYGLAIKRVFENIDEILNRL